jgi:putative two-component system response regulator
MSTVGPISHTSFFSPGDATASGGGQPSTPAARTEFAHMRVLIVDGDAGRRDLLTHALAQAGYIDTVSTGDLASTHRVCVAEQPDLVLLDLDEPGASAQALEDIRHLTEAPESLPVLAITADVARGTQARALSRGVRDFVAKPVDPTELLFRMRNALQTRQLQRQLADHSAILGETARDRTSELDIARESLSILAAIADYHDDDTYQHASRVGNSAALIAEALELPDAFVTMIRDAAPLHDIGKVGISRRILLKPDKLTPAEWEHMMRHVEMGAQILAAAQSPVLTLAAEIARTHHERWDGNGYLAGLSGEDIPIAGRITALADVWDTLTHERPYKPAWDEQRALAEIADQAGGHFDPRVVAAFGMIDRRAWDEPLAGQVAQRVA